MDKLKQKFSTVIALLFSSETRQTYGRAIALTWDILRETTLFLWLLFCSVFLVFFWGANYVQQANKNIKTWYAELDESQRQNVVGTAFASLQNSVGFSLGSSVELAKAQLDIKADPPALPAFPAAPAIAKSETKEESPTEAPTTVSSPKIETTVTEITGKDEPSEKV
jgi:hypothetical protein